MKPVNKKELLSILEMRVERHLSETISNFKNRSEDVLSRPSSSGGWSIAQCLDHLNSYGHYYLPEIKKALDQADRSDIVTFRSSWLGHYFIQMMEPETGKMKYKAFKAHIPESNLNASLVIAEFIRQQEELALCLHIAANQDLSIRLPVSITRLIRLKLGDVFQFLIAHNERHVQQAKRNLLHREIQSGIDQI